MALVCVYCERSFDPAVYGTNHPLAKTRDHIIPLVKGGSSHKENLIDACSHCNRMKAGMLLEEFSVFLSKKKGIGKNKLFELMIINIHKLILKKSDVKHLMVKTPKRGKSFGSSKAVRPQKDKMAKRILDAVIKKELPVYLGGSMPTFKTTELTHHEWIHRYNLEPQSNFHYED